MTTPFLAALDGQPSVWIGDQTFSVARPLVVEHGEGASMRPASAGYTSFDGRTGRGSVSVGTDCQVDFLDTWSVVGPAVRVERAVTVQGSAAGGYLTRLALPLPAPSWSDVRIFVPGMMYGDPQRVNRLALGGADALDRPGEDTRIREDRMPAPLLAAWLPSGNTVSLLNPAPDGATSIADAVDVTATAPIVDEDLRVGAFTVSQHPAGIQVGYSFPGCEGAVTYAGNTFPDGQLRRWRTRYHPLRDGHTQHYDLEIRLGRKESFRQLVRTSWRWAWTRLAPVVHRQDIRTAREVLFDQLASTVITTNGRAGIPLLMDAVTGGPHVTHRHRDFDALMGFTGRNTDCAWYLVRESERVDGRRAELFHRLGVAILDSFAAQPSGPPAGEGFDIRSGVPISSAPHQQRTDVMHLRGLAEGAKSMLRAWRFERDRGRNHPLWLQWGRTLTDWLLAQQRHDGSFPRSWLLASNHVADDSGYSSYNAISLLIEAYRATGEPRYLQAALLTGTYCWTSGHSAGVFVGGTLDNPDVIDKEAGTLSLEGYLALWDETHDSRWLDAAREAADFAETWIYLWDVPMPPGPDLERGWKTGVPTTGVQLIASGHSLVDFYMAFDVGSYAKLARHVDDGHYLAVAELLLHNTKVLLALPQRPFDLAGPGWQQEHWSLAPPRGHGLHRGWLPWVTCSHIEGLAVLEDFDPGLYERMTASTDAPAHAGERVVTTGKLT